MMRDFEKLRKLLGSKCSRCGGEMAGTYRVFTDEESDCVCLKCGQEYRVDVFGLVKI